MKLRPHQRKSLLCLTDNKFWQGRYGSSQRISEMLSWLSNEWQIAAFFPRSLEENEGWHAVHLFPFLHLYHAGGMFAEGEIIRRATRLQDVITTYRPRVLMAEYFWMTPMIQTCPEEHLRDVLLILDTHDVMHRRTNAFNQLGLDYWIQVTRAEEKFWLEHYDMLVAIQRDEAKVLCEMVDRPVVTVVHAREIEPLPLPKTAKPQRLGLFSSHGASQVHSTRTFLLETWPQLRNAFPDLQLHVFGHVADSLIDMTIPDGVRIRGFVENLRDAYSEMHAVINPAILASGLQIKSVEAVCFGRALLTTSIGLTGVPNVRSEESPFLVCDNVDGWKNAIANVVHDNAALEHRASLAVAFAARCFDRNNVYATFSRRISDMLEELPAHQPPSLQTRITAATHAFRRINVIPEMDSGTKRRIIIAGTGLRAQLLFACLPRRFEVFAFLDHDRTRQGGSIYSRPVLSPDVVRHGWDGMLLIADEAFEGDVSNFENAGARVANATQYLKNFTLFGCGLLPNLVAKIIPDPERFRIVHLKDPLETGSWEPSVLNEVGDQRIVIAHKDHEKIAGLLTSSGIDHDQISRFAPFIPEPLVIFGTGLAGEHAWACIDDKSRVIAFADNNPHKQGTGFLNRPVIGPAQLSGHPTAKVLIASMYHREIREQLISLGIDESRIERFDGRRTECPFQPRNVFRALRLTANILCEWNEADLALILFCVLSTKRVIVDWFDTRAVSIALIARVSGCETIVVGRMDCRDSLVAGGIGTSERPPAPMHHDVIFTRTRGVRQVGNRPNVHVVELTESGRLVVTSSSPPTEQAPRVSTE